MNYIQQNKEAWEETFDHKKGNWGDENYKRLLDEELPFLLPDVITELTNYDFSGKKVAQFACNNGRELLSIMQLGAAEGVGFDIAENIIAQAEQTAEKAGITQCKFIATNVLEIGEEYNESFDFIFFTIGAITWFQDLNQLFGKVAICLKPGGVLFINDFHPIMNMLPLPGEEAFDEANPKKFAYSYFQKEPWIENEGQGYIADAFPSKTFTSFSHPLSDQINAIVSSGLQIVKLLEFDYDIGLAEEYSHLGIPLSFILIAQK